MKKLMLIMLIIASATSTCSIQESQELPLQDIKDECLYQVQNDSYFYWMNKTVESIGASPAYTNIRIESWDDTPVDTLTMHDMYYMKEHIACLNMINATFDVVEPKVDYEWSLKYPDEYSMQQKNNIKRKYDAALRREEEAQAELNKWRGISNDSIGIDTIAYVVYHFVAAATDKKGEHEYFDYSYCYYNCINNTVDTVISIGNDLDTFKKSTKYVDLRVALPIVQNIK